MRAKVTFGIVLVAGLVMLLVPWSAYASVGNIGTAVQTATTDENAPPPGGPCPAGKIRGPDGKCHPARQGPAAKPDGGNPPGGNPPHGNPPVTKPGPKPGHKPGGDRDRDRDRDRCHQDGGKWSDQHRRCDRPPDHDQWRHERDRCGRDGGRWNHDHHRCDHPGGGWTPPAWGLCNGHWQQLPCPSGCGTMGVTLGLSDVTNTGLANWLRMAMGSEVQNGPGMRGPIVNTCNAAGGYWIGLEDVNGNPPSVYARCRVETRNRGCSDGVAGGCFEITTVPGQRPSGFVPNGDGGGFVCEVSNVPFPPSPWPPYYLPGYPYPYPYPR